MVGVLISGALGTVLYMGREFHFKHHREVGKKTDPNEVWHKVEDKKPKRGLILHFAKQITGFRIYGAAFGLLLNRRKVSQVAVQTQAPTIKGRNMDLYAILAMQSSLLLFFSLTTSWWVYFVFYLAPLITLTAFFESIRSFSEHVLPGETPVNYAEKNRLFFMCSSPIELFFISQFSFHYHHLHHLYPNVVTFKMPALHRWLLKNDQFYGERYLVRKSYIGTVLRYATNRPISGSGKYYPLRSSK